MTQENMISERTAEQLIIKAFVNITEHFDSVIKAFGNEAFKANEAIATLKKKGTPQEIEEAKRNRDLLIGRMEGLRDIAVPILQTAAEMIAAPAEDKEKVELILPDYLK